MVLPVMIGMGMLVGAGWGCASSSGTRARRGTEEEVPSVSVDLPRKLLATYNPSASLRAWCALFHPTGLEGIPCRQLRATPPREGLPAVTTIPDEAGATQRRAAIQQLLGDGEQALNGLPPELLTGLGEYAEIFLALSDDPTTLAALRREVLAISETMRRGLEQGLRVDPSSLRANVIEPLLITVIPIERWESLLAEMPALRPMAASAYVVHILDVLGLQSVQVERRVLQLLELNRQHFIDQLTALTEGRYRFDHLSTPELLQVIAQTPLMQTLMGAAGVSLIRESVRDMGSNHFAMIAIMVRQMVQGGAPLWEGVPEIIAYIRTSMPPKYQRFAFALERLLHLQEWSHLTVVMQMLAKMEAVMNHIPGDAPMTPRPPRINPAGMYGQEYNIFQ